MALLGTRCPAPTNAMGLPSAGAADADGMSLDVAYLAAQLRKWFSLCCEGMIPLAVAVLGSVMGFSRSDPHRPCLRRHSYGGSEVWFTNFPESEGDFDTLDADIGRAVVDLQRIVNGADEDNAPDDMSPEGKGRP